MLYLYINWILLKMTNEATEFWGENGHTESLKGLTRSSVQVIPKRHHWQNKYPKKN